MRSLALSCVLLYAIVGFVAGACPSSPDPASPSQSAHHHHQSNKPIIHPLACAWACHASVNHSAIDILSRLVPVWFVVSLLVFPEAWTGLTRLLSIFARPPPLFFA